jgi:hypothetical protein
MRGMYHASHKGLGPVHIDFDMWRQQNFALHTHGGFLTYAHHDAAGLCTFVYPV